MSVNVYSDDRSEYMKNPLYKHREFGDFTAFYITISLCTIFGLALFILNIFFCWCSKHKDYWQDSNTGNRWILPIWTKTPANQPPLDLTELEDVYSGPRPVYDTHFPEDEHLELTKRESDL
ncbi:wurmchen 1 transmembrane protein [Lycorma delicatula]|uniref:wurmchen 1 transmembrane protein n=1 Tax=Lycorma delicatula TaxID=130591 RepID=UPI003F519317